MSAGSRSDERATDAHATLQDEQPLPTVGQRLGDRYALRRLIGSGGFGAVFEAEDVRLQKPVAVKVLSARLAKRADTLQRFRREALAASRIGHEGIVDVTDFDRDDSGVDFIVMELLSGSDLAHELAGGRQMDVGRALEIAAQVAEALGAAHDKQIVHRDLKPANIYLVERHNRADVVKIIDFGISKVMARSAHASALTSEGVIVGTPHYMAPEQARGAGDLDGRVDVYSLGVILYEMLTGRRPFTGKTFLAVITSHLTDTAAPLAEHRPELAQRPRLQELVSKAMAKNPINRFQDMRALGEAILEVLSEVDADAANALRPNRLRSFAERRARHRNRRAQSADATLDAVATGATATGAMATLENAAPTGDALPVDPGAATRDMVTLDPGLGARAPQSPAKRSTRSKTENPAGEDSALARLLLGDLPTLGPSATAPMPPRDRATREARIRQAKTEKSLRALNRDQEAKPASASPAATAAEDGPPQPAPMAATVVRDALGAPTLPDVEVPDHRDVAAPIAAVAEKPRSRGRLALAGALLAMAVLVTWFVLGRDSGRQSTASEESPQTAAASEPASDVQRPLTAEAAETPQPVAEAPQPTDEPPPPTTAVPEPTAAPAPQLQLTSDVSGARATAASGEDLGPLPLSLPVPAPDSPQTIVVTAPGHRQRRVRITHQSDLTIEVELKKSSRSRSRRDRSDRTERRRTTDDDIADEW